MDFNNNFRFTIGVRVGLVLLTCIFLVNSFYTDSYTLTKLLLLIALVVQGYSLAKYLDKSNIEFTNFLNSIKYDDFTQTYSTKRTGTSQDELYERFNMVIQKFREIRAEKEAQYQYLRTIVQHVGIGIITFNKAGQIQIINAAAKSLLDISQIKSIDDLSDLNPELVNSLKDLQTGGRDLIKIDRKGEEIQLSVYAIQLVRREEEFKLVSIQNIKSELDEKEMDAWQNLVNVLTHEIMNSVTPISSLAATVESNLADVIDEEFNVKNISKEDIEDFHMAVHTIHRRSESLIKFVSDFRNLTRIPIPKKSTICLEELFTGILTLLKHDIQEQQIEVTTQIQPTDICINADQEQIEQVLINLLKNAIQALEENPEEHKNKKLKIEAGFDEFRRVYIHIKDNGSGIDEEAVKKIFIPFFTTKKSGSGIGLSLSKQIMRKHNGNISVSSTIDVGTTFTLVFNE
ncbi:PAS domain-containing sensor histidine kinase [Reichenbachiella sp. MSK19-1]|uniref:sensor histidine kinase n=1 Tax=Reichenbachiella sp. MSK19-1 TaxID=1897631 RepID=UPI000E6CC4FD|nr:ATP-binding protein [Reichenbachiella sp. MSK19-1]RJE70507.1 histidine kinase [Reichenbachiella sp. MSK19-1]